MENDIGSSVDQEVGNSTLVTDIHKADQEAWKKLFEKSKEYLTKMKEAKLIEDRYNESNKPDELKLAVQENTLKPKNKPKKSIDKKQEWQLYNLTRQYKRALDKYFNRKTYTIYAEIDSGKDPVLYKWDDTKIKKGNFSLYLGWNPESASFTIRKPLTSTKVFKKIELKEDKWFSNLPSLNTELTDIIRLKEGIQTELDKLVKVNINKALEEKLSKEDLKKVADSFLKRLDQIPGKNSFEIDEDGKIFYKTEEGVKKRARYRSGGYLDRIWKEVRVDRKQKRKEIYKNFGQYLDSAQKLVNSWVIANRTEESLESIMRSYIGNGESKEEEIFKLIRDLIGKRVNLNQTINEILLTQNINLLAQSIVGYTNKGTLFEDYMNALILGRENFQGLSWTKDSKSAASQADLNLEDLRLLGGGAIDAQYKTFIKKVFGERSERSAKKTQVALKTKGAHTESYDIYLRLASNIRVLGDVLPENFTTKQFNTTTKKYDKEVNFKREEKQKITEGIKRQLIEDLAVGYLK